jgi:hypothetical protein
MLPPSTVQESTSFPTKQKGRKGKLGLPRPFAINVSPGLCVDWVVALMRVGDVPEEMALDHFAGYVVGELLHLLPDVS